MLIAISVSGGLTVAQDDAADSSKAWDPDDILGSKHDLSHLNTRAGVNAMGGVAYSDYDDACVYCHIPPDTDKSKPGQIADWNRIRPIADEYQLFKSQSSKIAAQEPSDISLLCLSCHDGTLAVDRVAHKPRIWNSSEDFSLHMRMSNEDDLDSCGKCHDGSVAHSIASKNLGTDLRDDHPISIPYSGMQSENRFFKTADSPAGFENGVRLYDGMIECASCHDIHNSEAEKLLRVDADVLCSTCHNK